MKSIDICGLGELMVDFTSLPPSPEGKPCYMGNPGGAPPNVLAAAARQGLKTSFLTRVGADAFGQFLVKVMQDLNIGTEGIVMDPDHNTTLAFVHNAPDGDRSFTFYRRSCADAVIAPADVNEAVIRNSKVLQIGSLVMSTPSGKETTFHAVQVAREAGTLVSFDPNLRPNIWPHPEEMLPFVREMLPLCDILKLSEEEAEALTGSADVAVSSRLLTEEYPNIRLCLVTLGDKGCFWRTARDTGRTDSVSVKAVDTTGCGDAFTGGVLTRFLSYGCTLEELTADQVSHMTAMGCAIGAFVATKYGGVMSMPTKQELRDFAKENCYVIAD